MSFLFWAAAASGIFFTWENGVEAAAEVLPGAPVIAYSCALILLVMIGLYINSLIMDALVGSSAVSVRELPQGQRQAKVKSLVKQELAGGNYRVAVVHYEEAGMYAEALKLAEEHKDHKLMARIAWRMGRYERARQHYIQDGNHAGAGNQSVLLGDIQEARKHYGKAADSILERGNMLRRAGFLDRARRWKEAAPIYEAEGELEKAADCYELMGEVRKARDLRRNQEAMRTLKTPAEGVRTTGLSERISASTARTTTAAAASTDADAKRRAAVSAKELAAFGDVYASAWIYREVESWAHAGECYERMEEWERAVMCYQRAGQKEKAAALRAKIPAGSAPIGERKPERGAGDDEGGREGEIVAPPSPSQAEVVPFIPLGQQPVRYIPVSEDVLRRIGAQLPAEGASRETWEKLAMELEDKNAYSEAAEIYMRLGNANMAIRCMAHDSRPIEAALMAIGIGDLPMAAEHLVDALEKKNDEDVGLLLGEMLIRIGDWHLAERLLRRRLAPKITDANARFVYRYARLFEDAGAIEQAAKVYRSLIVSGAKSIELEDRLARMERLSEGLEQYDATTMLSGKQGRTGRSTQREIDEGEARDRARQLVESRDGEGSSELETRGVTGETPSSETVPESSPPYPFIPPAHTPFLGDISIKDKKKEGAPDTPEDATAAVSLFGRLQDMKEKGAPAGAARKKDGDDLFNPDRRYEIVRELGKGGMGVVYEARDTVLSRRVAMKVINTVDAPPESLRQFLLEARAIAQLTHPNVIMIFDVGLLELRHYIAMEFIDGNDLRQYIGNKGQMPFKEALRVFIEMCEGLMAVHDAGIIHRDIKPANVLLTNTMHAKLVDFGLAKLEAKEGEEEEEGGMMSAGTPGYMPPEQIRGEELTPACDIYALGITLFHMLVGQAPHHIEKLQKRMDIFHFTMDGKLPSIRTFREDVPEAIDHLYRYCTAVEVGDRYQSIGAFLPVIKQWHEAE